MRKGRKLTVVKTDCGDAQVYFDRKSNKFSAQVAGQTLEHTDLAVLVKRVKDELTASAHSYEWKPVMELVAGYSSFDRLLYVNRYYVAKIHSGAWRRSEWDTPDSSRPLHMQPLSWADTVQPPVVDYARDFRGRPTRIDGITLPYVEEQYQLGLRLSKVPRRLSDFLQTALQQPISWAAIKELLDLLDKAVPATQEEEDDD